MPISPATLAPKAKWRPTSLPGLVLWLDFTKSAFLRNASGAAPSNGEKIATALDRSASGNNATQATDGTRPTFINPLLNGMGGAQFATTNYLDLASSIATAVDGAATVAYIVKHGGVYADTILGHSATGPALNGASATLVRWRDDTGTNTGFTVSNMGTSGHVVMWTRSTAGSIRNWIDGVASVSNPQTNAGAVTWSRVGARQTSDPLDGYLGGIVVYNYVLTTPQQNLLGRYLAQPYGLTWTNL